MCGYVCLLWQLVGAEVSQNDVAAAFSAALKSPVEYMQATYDATHKTYLNHSMPAWLAHGLLPNSYQAGFSSFPIAYPLACLLACLLAGVLEVFTAMDNCEAAFVTETGDFHAITGQNPMSVADWVAHHAQAFV